MGLESAFCALGHPNAKPRRVPIQAKKCDGGDGSGEATRPRHQGAGCFYRPTDSRWAFRVRTLTDDARRDLVEQAPDGGEWQQVQEDTTDDKEDDGKRKQKLIAGRRL